MTGSESQTKVQFFDSHVFPILVLWPDPIDAGIYAVLLVFTALITIFLLIMNFLEAMWKLRMTRNIH